MWIDRLLERTLIPDEADQIDKIIAYVGYASPHFARDHVSSLKRLLISPPSIDIIMGMTSYEGIGDATHREFCAVEKENIGRFTASYRTARPPSHMKIYVWLRGETPVRAFLGSPNYSRTAFGSGRQDEVLTEVDPGEAFSIVQTAQLRDVVRCSASNVESLISIVPERYWRPSGRSTGASPILGTAITITTSIPELKGLPFVSLSLLQRNGEIHDRGGLNWGQRPEEGRDPNQGYIPVPTNIQRTDFFPGRDIVFSLISDDGFEMRAHVTGAGGKNLTSVPNSSLGAYFRRRIGLASGERVNTSDLAHYGRTDVEIYRLSDDVYYMFFCVQI
ncbi:MAG: NgoFVII family restriction endonuclease [Chlorobium sp.]|nr:NgoFVII family restriction endonuclease [Chlorobium sp.]